MANFPVRDICADNHAAVSGLRFCSKVFMPDGTDRYGSSMISLFLVVALHAAAGLARMVRVMSLPAALLEAAG